MTGLILYHWNTVGFNWWAARPTQGAAAPWSTEMPCSPRPSPGAPPSESAGSPRGSLGAFAAGATAIAAVLFGYYALTWRSVTGVLAAMDACRDLFCDFRIYYYPMGEAVFRTGMPVDGFLYSPFAAILLAAFAPFGLQLSLVLWGILQAVFIALYLVLFRRLVPAGLPVQMLFVFLALSSYPFVINFVAGQVGIFMIVGLLGMLVLAERGHRAVAGALFAFAVGFKFYPAIFVVPFFARRDWRAFLLATGACVALLFVVPGLLLGFGDTLGFYGGLLKQYGDSDWVVANPHSNYFPHVVLHMASAMGGDARPWLPVLTWISFGLAAVNMGLIFLVERARLRHAGLWSFQVAVVTIPFVLKTSWVIDFLPLAVTQAVLAWRLLEGETADPGRDAAGRGRMGRGRAAIMTGLLVASIVLSNIVFFNLFGDFSGYGFWAFLFWANLALMAALYLELLPPALRQLRKGDRARGD